jgi:hypothetical protein
MKKSRTTTLEACTVPGCERTRRGRGLCHPHYQNYRSLDRKGLAASEEDLMERGLLLPEGTGGAGRVGRFAGFQIGSEIRGESS